MAIQETILGPNSSMFAYAATDTVTDLMTALDTYITAHGWSLYDAAAPQGQTVGRVYRTLQDGSTSVYKYVGFAMSNTSIQLKNYESWNATTHVGTNDGSYSGATSNHVIALNIGVASSVYLFVNPKWFAVRTRTNNLVLSHMIGAFEIRKDYGEAESIPSNIFMTTNYGLTYPYNNVLNVFGSCRSTTGGVGQAGSNNNSVVTALGVVSGGSTNAITFNAMLGTNYVIANSTLTMTACEMVNTSVPTIQKLRGRILGLKIVSGSTYWNDMDQIQVGLDSDYFQVPNGTATNHHIFAIAYSPISNGYLRFVLPI